MSVLRKLGGLLLILAALGAVGFGVYIDIVYLLVGGIVEVVDGIEANPNDGSMIGWGIVRVLFAGIGLIVGVLVAVFLGGIGLVLMGMKSRRRRR